MGAHKTKPWTVLRGEDGDAITVPSEDANVIEAILELVSQEMGLQYAADNLAILKAAEGVKVECWHSVTKAMAEGEGIWDFDSYNAYYAPGGDGKRWVWVVSIETSAWVLSELCGDALFEESPESA